ncbi:MAG: hypothetical protein KBB33_00300 [Candidatus Cloacimonetes bacterium]|nr:hypothetical protein [Candidatus Cloacimonadota bacterium]HOA28532.1 hypothetical protein [Candidatus Cloacimonadota bacterium]
MKDPNITIRRAMDLQSSNWIHALHILREAADENPREAKYQIAIADIFASRASYEKALQHYLIALSLDPSDQQVTAMIANSYLSTGEYRLALAYYQKILDPTDDIIYNTAITQAFLGKHQECIDTLLKILPHFPNHPFIYYILVEQYYYLGDLDTAIQYIDLSKKNSAINAQMYTLGGIIYADRKQYLMAYDFYRKADQLSPLSHTDHVNKYARAALECGLWQTAIKIYERNIHRHPMMSEPWVEIIKIYMDQGNYSAATRYLDMAKKHVKRPGSVLRLLQERLKLLT